MKHLFLFCTILSFVASYGQKEDYIWFGGYDWDADINDTIYSVEGYRLDFNRKPFGVENDIGFRYGILGNNASICNKKGDLLFFTNGCTVYNKYFQIMPNGDSINAGEWFDKLWKTCAAGYPGVQDVLILPDPGNESGYYLFHKPNIYNPGGNTYRTLNYSYIDLTLDGGNGDVTLKNKTFYGSSVLFNYFTAVKHQNKKDWWLIQPKTDDSIFVIFLVDENGINGKSDQKSDQLFDRSKYSATGTARFSPDGKKYAIYNYYNQLHVYDFDRNSGKISNHKKIEIYPPQQIDFNVLKVGSVEWSPNGRFIYCASWDNLHQVDMWASDPQNSVLLIDSYNGTQDPFETNFYLMAQGPDCRIYLTPPGGQNSIHVINNPNELGTACNFVQNGIKFLYPNGGTLPNFPRFRVDEEEKCDSTIVSVLGDAIFYRRDLEVFPNPSNGLFAIKLPEAIGKANLVVTNVNGQIIFQKDINQNSIEELDITKVAAGRYNIEVYPLVNEDRVFYGKQVVKI